MLHSWTDQSAAILEGHPQQGQPQAQVRRSVAARVAVHVAARVAVHVAVHVAAREIASALAGRWQYSADRAHIRCRQHNLRRTTGPRIHNAVVALVGGLRRQRVVPLARSLRNGLLVATISHN